jgi:pyrimidine operon attenuation protein/uracil phosphoribosyltransferase
MSHQKVKILETSATNARLKRMAYEIFERNFQEKSLFMIGVDERGGKVASQLTEHLRRISSLEVHLWGARLDRAERQGKGGKINVTFEHGLTQLEKQAVVVVDDVLYSGNTMLHVVAPLLKALPRKIEIAVLIDRGHRFMPISPNYVGLDLATNLHQHVAVEINEEDWAAYLI